MNVSLIGKELDLVCGFLGATDAILVNTFFPCGFTRFPCTGRADSRPSQLDFFISSPQLCAKPLRRDLPFKPPSDHKPQCFAFVARKTDRQLRKNCFAELLAPQIQWHSRVPATWLPTSEEAYKQKVRNCVAEDPPFENLPLLLNEAAKATTKWENTQEGNDLKELYKKLRAAKCPTLRKAYQILINAQTLRRRRDLELRQLMRWASGKEWHFDRHRRFRQNLRIPSKLSRKPGQSRLAPNLGRLLR